jgi:hypothetical protein
MAETKKIIDEALLDIQEIQAVLKANTKEILRATMNEEITQIMKESINEADYEEEDITDDEKESKAEKGEDDLADDDTKDDDIDITKTDKKSEKISKPVEEPVDDLETSPEVEAPIDATAGTEEPTEDNFSELDLTGASDEEVISVFKKMKDEDEVEVVSDSEVKITDPESGNEYFIRLGGSKKSAEEPVSAAPEFGAGEEGAEESNDEIYYEVELKETENIEPANAPKGEGTPRGKGHDSKDAAKAGTMPKGDIEGQKAEKSTTIKGDNLTGGFKEKTPGKQDGHAEEIMEDDETIDEKIVVGMAQDGKAYSDLTDIKGAGGKVRDTKSTKESVVAKYNSLIKEVKSLRSERETFKTNLAKFRDMLAETVVYNQNLTYVVKLFTEHSTTRSEKENIMKRFDSEATSLKESKNLYKSLVGDLKTKKPMAESVENKINKTHTSSTSVINESTAYVDESTKRINDLIHRVEGR